MQRLQLHESRTFSPTVDLMIEASWEAIRLGNLDWLEGEQFDTIHNVVSMDVTPNTVTFETTRSMRGYKAGEPNAGRGRFVFDRDWIESVHVRGPAAA